MELPMAAVIAVLFGAGTYLILRPNLIRLVMGFGLYSNATNLLLITVGGYTKQSAAPFMEKGATSTAGLMDPLPPDIILTAIVISFAVSALMLTICYRVYRDHETDDPMQLPVDDDYDEHGALVLPSTGDAAVLGRNDGHGALAGAMRGRAAEERGPSRPKRRAPGTVGRA